VVISLVRAADSDTALRILARYGESEPELASDRRTIEVPVGEGPRALQYILSDFASQGIELHDAGMRRPTLDDVFLRITGHKIETDGALNTTNEMEEAK
jgi:ABC-2 type transport system ATP-binding protein